MLTRRQRDEAWGVIRETRGLGIEMKADVWAKRIRYRPAARMPLDLFRRLQQHRRAVLLILAALDMPIPPDRAPGTSEPCQFCGACRWQNPTCWQCGACHVLWRPARAALKTRRAGDGAA